MRILVTAASKHGSTDEIAAVIARRLTDEGLQVTVLGPDDVTDLGGYDAVVLGSAVYGGHWLEPARTLVERLRTQLASRRVWLFSSGPVGDPPMPEEDPVEVAEIVTATAARAHKVFAGNIDKTRLSFPERAIVRALRAPVGDFRDWDDIASWTKQIVEVLQPSSS